MTHGLDGLGYKIKDRGLAGAIASVQDGDRGVELQHEFSHASASLRKEPERIQIAAMALHQAFHCADGTVRRVEDFILGAAGWKYDSLKIHGSEIINWGKDGRPF